MEKKKANKQRLLAKTHTTNNTCFTNSNIYVYIYSPLSTQMTIFIARNTKTKRKRKKILPLENRYFLKTQVILLVVPPITLSWPPHHLYIPDILSVHIYSIYFVYFSLPWSWEQLEQKKKKKTSQYKTIVLCSSSWLRGMDGGEADICVSFMHGVVKSTILCLCHAVTRSSIWSRSLLFFYLLVFIIIYIYIL